jgi:GABA permease
MGTYIVVAHRTLVGQHLLDYAEDLVRREPGSRFHLVVPVRHPRGAWNDGQIEGVARKRLDEGLAAFNELGLEVTGEVGDASPVYAVSTALRNLGFDAEGIILSTLPPRMSAWLHMDVESRMRKEFDLPITHLVADRAKAGAGS